MTAVICDTCEQYIETTNRTFPGYCSPACRDHAHAERERRRQAARLRRAEARVGEGRP
jgi:hypothetical protein